MSDLEPNTRAENFWVNEGDLEPITRKEQYIKHLYDETQVVPEYPKTREEYFINKAGEELHDVTVEQLNVTENGTYSEAGKAYSPVVVEVPEPTLISKSISENGTYNASSDNADGYSSVDVNVAGYKISEVSGLPSPIATFTDGSPLPMPNLKIAVEPQQEGSGDPSPENIRPISGWSAVDVVDDAVYGGFINWNQLVQNGNFASKSGWVNNNVVSSVSNNIMKFTASANQGGVYKGNIKFAKGHRYVFSTFVKADNGVSLDYLVYHGGYSSEEITGTGSWEKIEVIFVANQTMNDGFIYPIRDKRSSGWTEIAIKNVMLIDLTQLFGSTKADEIYAMEQAQAGSGVAYFKSLFYKDYYPYNSGEITNVSAVNGDTDKYFTITIQLGDTYYGGKLDVVSGVLTLTHGYIASYNGETLPSTWISDRDVYAEGTTPTIGAEVCYELATPTTIQLTPTAVSSLLGSNNLWANTGDVLEASYFESL